MESKDARKSSQSTQPSKAVHSVVSGDMMQAEAAETSLSAASHNIINNKVDYMRFLAEDQKALGAFTRHPVFHENIMILLTDPCWKFQKLLRKLEYWSNCRNKGIYKIYIWWLRKKFQKLSLLLGMSIPINVFGEGLAIVHYGSIVVSRHARIGKNCTIHSCTNIGGNGTAAIIGDNCFIGPGVKIIQPVILENNVKIGANAVVDKSFHEDNITLAGVPAKIIKRE